MDYAVIIGRILLLFGIAAIGFVAGKTGILGGEINKKLSSLVLNVTLPAMIVASVTDVPAGIGSLDIIKLLGVSCMLYAVMLIPALLVPRLMKTEQKNKGICEFLIWFGNVGFMGFPVVSSIYGSGAVFLVAVFNLPMNLLCFTLGIWMVAPEGTKIRLKEVLSPAVIASVLAPVLYLLPVSIPVLLYDGLGLLGDATVPLAMMLVGASLAQMPLRDMIADKAVYPPVTAKLILCPVIVGFLLMLLPLDPEIYGIAVLLAAMPSASLGTLFAIQYGSDAELASKTVCLSTLASAVTVPLAVLLFL